MTREILCKLTNKNMMTRNRHKWEIGVAAPALEPGGKLCSESYYHCYSHPLLAVLLNPCHGNIQQPRLFIISAAGERLDDNGLKIGFKTMTLLEEIELPKITLAQKVAFALLCAKAINKDPKWNEWADNWLAGKDRSEEEARSAADAAEANAAEAAAWAAAWAARAARAAMSAAMSAATMAVNEVEAEAAVVAEAAARAMEPIDLIAIACSAIAEY